MSTMRAVPPGGLTVFPRTLPCGQLDEDIVVYGSTKLVHTLMEHDLVDEVRLILFPVVLGAGEHIFGETGDKTPMRLVQVRPVGDKFAFLSYERDHGGRGN